jgi:AdoMet-dependent heme synthase
MTRAATAVRVPRHDVAARPFLVIWEATRACPLACRHCRAEATPDRDPAELTTAEATAMMRQVADFGRPPPLLVITGGDPFQRPDLFDLVRAGTGAGLRVAVAPSGTPTLNPASLRALHAAGAVALSLSLDGSTAAIHDGFRRVDQVYEWTLRAWQAARDTGLKVQINTTVARHNLTDLPNIVHLVAEYGAMTWSAFLLVPMGRGRDLGTLTPAEVEDVLNFVYDAGAVVPAKTTEGHHFRRVVIQRRILAEHGGDHIKVLGLGPLYTDLRRQLEESGLARETGRSGEGGRPGPGHEPSAPRGPRSGQPGPHPGGGTRHARRPPMDVNAGRGFVFVSHTGTVHPSGFLPLSAGRIRQQPLTEIYRTSELLISLRDPGRLAGRCGRCEFQLICGGSRSRAFAVTGDAYGEEPWCSYQPGSFPYQASLDRFLPGPRAHQKPFSRG